MIKGVAGKIYVEAYDSTDGTDKTGDAANLTAHISKDGAADAPLTDTTAVEVDATTMPGLYVFDISATENDADVVAISCISTTSNIKCNKQVIYTDDKKADYGGAIHIDTVNGSAGAVLGVNGLPTNPVNNIGDAFTLATALGVRWYKIRGSSNIVDPGQDYTEWTIEGVDAGSQFNMLNRSFANTLFIQMSLTGALGTGPIHCHSCDFNGPDKLLGTFENCIIVDDISIAAGSSVFRNCASGVAGDATPVITFDSVAVTNLSMRNHSGGSEFSMMSANHTISYDCPTGQMIINVNCTGGSITRRGMHSITDNSGNVTLTELSAFERDDIADAVWNAILSGGTYNIGNSAGRRLRELTDTIRHSGTAQGPGIGTNQIQLDTGASAVDGMYDPALIGIVSGTGAGQLNEVLEYRGSDRVATMGRDWKVVPDATSGFIIYSNQGDGSVNEGLIRAATANTAQLNALAMTTDDIYIDQTLWIVSGAGADGSYRVIDYDSATQTVTIEGTFYVALDTTSGYRMLPSLVRAECDTATIAANQLLHMGSGFATATDSNEAIRNRGDIAWVGGAGSGSIAWTYTLTEDDDVTPIADALIEVFTDIGMTNKVAENRTTAFGVAAFFLDAGTYYIKRTKSGFSGTNPDTEVVS